MPSSTPQRITLNQLADEVFGFIERGDQPREAGVDRREIIQHLRDAAHFLIKGEWFQNRAEGNKFINGQYIANFTLPVLNDAVRGQNYSEIPIDYVSLPMDMGIYSVRANAEDFIPVPSEVSQIYDLPGGKFSYEVEAYRIYFNPKDSQTPLAAGLSQVRAKIVTVSPTDAGEDEPFPFPADKRWELMNMVLERMGIREKFPEDLTNNENTL